LKNLIFLIFLVININAEVIREKYDTIKIIVTKEKYPNLYKELTSEKYKNTKSFNYNKSFVFKNQLILFIVEENGRVKTSRHKEFYELLMKDRSSKRN